MAAFTYPRSEPGSAGHLDLVEQLGAHDLTLRGEIAGVTDATLTRRPQDGEWSIKEIVGHLCDVSRLLHKRLYMMIKLEEPQLIAYDPIKLAAARNAHGVEIDELLGEFSSQRSETVDMLADLVHWNWARTGKHPQVGRLSIRQQVELWLEHEDEHMAQIRSLKELA
jgi:hypothetical protein